MDPLGEPEATSHLPSDFEGRMKSVDDDVQQVLHTLAAPSILLDSDKQHFDLQRPVHLPTWMLIVQPSSWIQLWSDP